MSSIAFLTYSKFPEPTEDDSLAIEQLKTRGIRVSACVWDETPVKALLNYDLVIVRSMWDYHEKSEVFHGWLEEVATLKIRLLNPVALLQWNASKKYLRGLELQNNIPIVPTVWIEPNEKESFRKLAELPWDELVIKPEISASADLTFRVKRKEVAHLSPKIDQILNRGALLVQPFCESVIEGEYSLIYFAETNGYGYSHAVLKRPKVGDFRVQEEWGGSMLPIEAPQALKDIAELAVSSIPGAWLYARVDLIYFEGSPRLAELELIEPHLYFGMNNGAAIRFCDALFSFL